MDPEIKKRIISGKVFLITGGTGSLGNKIVREIIKYSPKKVIILSRDEDKQYNMANELPSPLIQFELGDIRDEKRMKEVTKGVDIIIHAAALKHVPPSEKEPMEFIKTNILGTHNIIESAIFNEVPIVIGVGTDKAVKPINVYGMTKSLQEKMMIAANKKNKTKFTCVRYGNVIGSRGSVIPFFKKKIINNEVLTITNPNMTRFLLKLEEAINLIFHAIDKGEGGEIFVKKMPACRMDDLADAMGVALSNNPNYPKKVIGFRPGEKIHEVLVSEDEMRRAKELEDMFIIQDYGHEGNYSNAEKIEEYGSYNTKRLNQEEIILLLKEDGWA
jgi:FlaA1/EpsC-like NDP-sugar epimerase